MTAPVVERRSSVEERRATLPHRDYPGGVSAVDWVSIRVDVEHFRARVFQDALNEATASYWRRRALAFEWARPRRGDDRRTSSPGELGDAILAYDRCSAIALACRRRAALAQIQDPDIDPEVWVAIAYQAETDLRDALDAGDAAAIRAASQRVDDLEQIGRAIRATGRLTDLAPSYQLDNSDDPTEAPS